MRSRTGDVHSDRRKGAAALKPIYGAANVDDAVREFEHFDAD